MKTPIALCVIALSAALAAVGCANPEAAKKQSYENGNKHLAEKKYKEAIVEYRNALKHDDRFGEARLKLAEAYELAGNEQNAYREYVRAADRLPDSVTAQVKAATYLLLAGRYSDAEQRATRALEKDPRNVDAQVVLGNAVAGLKDLDTAIDEIEAAIGLDPKRALTYTNLALLRLARGQRDQARVAFQRAVEVDPRSVPALLSLAHFQWSVGELGPARDTLKRALDVDPNHVVAHRALAALYMASNRAAEAEPHLVAVAAKTNTPQARFALADYYLATNRPDAARQALAPLAGDDTTFAAAQERLARLEYGAGQFSRAHAMLDSVLKREPNNTPIMVLKGNWLLAEGKRDEALVVARAASTADPQSIAAHYLLGMVHAQRRDIEDAIKAFGEVVRLNPRAAAAQVQLSRLELSRGKSEAAVELARDAVTNAPAHPVARLTLAEGLIARRELPRAEAEIALLLKAYPQVARVHSLNGSLQFLKKNIPGARAAYERALELDPRSAEALSAVTTLDMMQKNAARARARVDSSIAAEPTRADLLVIAAKVYAADRDLTRAEQLLRQAVTHDPSSTQAYGLLAQIYLSQGKLDQARAEFDGIAARDPRDIASRTVAATILQVQNNAAEAKKRYEAILAIDSRAALAANNLAWLYAEEGGELDRAQELAETAIALLPDRPELQDTLGWIYYKKSRLTLAIRQFQESIARAPSNPLFHYHLALAHAKRGEIAQAREALQAALRIKPDYDEARRLMASLAS